MNKKAIAAFALMLSSGLASAQRADPNAGWYASVDLEASSASGATAVSNQSHAGMGWLIGAGATYDFAGGLFTKLGWDHYASVGDGASTGQGSIDMYSLGVGMRF